MYRRHFKAVIGFHGCDLEVAKRIICEEHALKSSENVYDWLGPGIYFWENSPERATIFAAEQARRRTRNNRGGNDLPRQLITTPAVIGAVLDLGLCLDLTDQVCLDEMRAAYRRLKKNMELARMPLPHNEGVTGAGDKWNRQLDCAVIKMVHHVRREDGKDPYESVRSPFYEGHKLYDGTEFTERAHTQIAVRNPNCVKGVFWPRGKLPWPLPIRTKAAARRSKAA